MQISVVSASIIVVGSSNTDMVIKTHHLPVPGETVIGGQFFMNAGGKGANQAVAAARLGGQVTLIAKTGNDIFGQQAAQLFASEGIDTRFILTDPEQPSGVALITVDEHAENCIVVASGANATLRPQDLDSSMTSIYQASIVLMQLEIPLETVEYVARKAFERGISVVLNPAPANTLANDLYRHISIITPNSKEASMLTGIEVIDPTSAIHAGKELIGKGVSMAIITMGAAGAMVITNDIQQHVPAPAVKAVDTTAAGDVFNGALCVALAEGMPLLAAVEFASRAAAISVTRLGAQASAPRRHELSTMA